MCFVAALKNVLVQPSTKQSVTFKNRSSLILGFTFQSSFQHAKMETNTQERNLGKTQTRTRTGKEKNPVEKIQPWKRYFDQPDIPDVADGAEPKIRMEREKDAPDGLGG